MNEKPPSNKMIVVLLIVMLTYCYLVMYAAQVISYIYFEGK